MDNATYLDFERNLKKFFSKIGSDLPKFREYVLNLIIKNGFTHEGISLVTENHIENKLKNLEPNQALDAMSELMDGIIDTGTRISFPDILDSNPYDLALVIENLQSDYDWKKMDELVNKIAINLGNEEGWALRTAIPESTAFRWEMTFGEQFADFYDGLVEEGVIQKGEFLDFDFDTRKELYQDWLKEAKENIKHYVDGTKTIEEIETTSPYYHWLAAGDNEQAFIEVNQVIKKKLGDTKSTFTYSDAHKLYLKNKLGLELGDAISIRKEIVKQIVNKAENLGDAVRIKLFDTLTDVPELNLGIFEPGKRFVNPSNGINQLLEKLNLDEKPRDVISLEMFDVNDFYVVPPDKLQEAVNLVKNDPRYALDVNAMHKDYLEMLENAIVETGFIGDTDTRGGLYADLDVVLEDWLSEGGDLEGNKFFNNSPTWDNLPDTQNVRGLIASAGGPNEITPGYKMPQYFKDQENVPYKAPDTPTNVVDEIKSTMIGYDNQVESFKNLDKNVIGELPVEKVSELFGQNVMERPESISYDEFIKNYPVDELGPIPFYEGTGDTLTPDDWLRVQDGTGYQLKEGITPEEFRKSLDKFIDQIDNPYIKEGLLSRYEKYDKFAESIVDQTVKSRILGSVNQDVFYDVVAFNDDLYTTKKTEDMAIVFEGYEEPTPIEDAVIGELEDWELDAEGNRIKPEKPGMDKYDRTLNGYYKYYTDIPDTPTNVVDAPTQGKVIESPEDLQEYIDPQAVNKVEEFASKFPDKFKQIVKVAGEIPKKALTAAQVLDPGDIVITQGLRTLLPRLGAAAIAPAALTAYVAYELSVLAVDAANAYNKAIEKQGGPNDFVPSFMGGKTLKGEEPTYIDYDWKQLGKDTWSEFGDVSDTWSLSWKISEPMINWAFDKISSYNGEQ